MNADERPMENTVGHPRTWSSSAALTDFFTFCSPLAIVQLPGSEVWPATLLPLLQAAMFDGNKARGLLSQFAKKCITQAGHTGQSDSAFPALVLPSPSSICAQMSLVRWLPFDGFGQR